jgi:hypothetical protein
MGSQPFPSSQLDLQQQYRYKQRITKPAQIHFHSKDHTLSQKYINVDITVFNLILYLFIKDCLQPMAMSGFPQNTYMNT